MQESAVKVVQLRTVWQIYPKNKLIPIVILPLNIEITTNFHKFNWTQLTPRIYRSFETNLNESSLHLHTIHTRSESYLVVSLDQREPMSTIAIFINSIFDRLNELLLASHSIAPIVSKLGHKWQRNKAVRSPKLWIVGRSHRTSVSWGMD